jgi:hypothetical protein
MEVQELIGALFNIALVVMIVAVVESVADIAGEAVELLDNDEVEFPCPSVFEESGTAGAFGEGEAARDATVAVGVDHLPVLGLSFRGFDLSVEARAFRLATWIDD